MEHYREDLDSESRCPDPACTCDLATLQCKKCNAPVFRVDYHRPSGSLIIECLVCGASLGYYPIASKFQGIGLRTIKQ